MAIPGWPSLVDDDGTYRVGTRLVKAIFDAIEAAIEALCVGLAGETPADIGDEVVAARGTCVDLDTRLSVALNDDGTLKTDTTIFYVDQYQDTDVENLCPDGGLYLWPDGDAAAPYNWTLSGTGATIARCGSGLGDTTTVDALDWCAKLTYGTGTLNLVRTILSAAQIGRLSTIKGRTVTVACRAISSVPSQLQITVTDGVNVVLGGATGNSSYHAGDGSESWIYATITIDAAATELTLGVRQHSAGSCYVGAFMVVLGEFHPVNYIDCRQGSLEITTQQRGDIAVVSDLNELRKRIIYPDGALLNKTYIDMGTGPVGDDAIWDVNKNGSSAYTTNLPQVDDGDAEGEDAPDGTYANRCFKQGDLLTVDCDQTGIGTLGAEATITVQFLVPLPRWPILNRWT